MVKDTYTRMTTFKYKNESYKQLERKKANKKNGVIFQVSFLSKKAHFLQFCANLIKKSKSVKATYIYASESSLSENGMTYRGLYHRSWDNSDQNIEKVVDLAEILRLQTLISETISHSIITSFSESVERAISDAYT